MEISQTIIGLLMIRTPMNCPLHRARDDRTCTTQTCFLRMPRLLWTCIVQCMWNCSSQKHNRAVHTCTHMQDVFRDCIVLHQQPPHSDAADHQQYQVRPAPLRVNFLGILAKISNLVLSTVCRAARSSFSSLAVPRQAPHTPACSPARVHARTCARI